MNAEVLAVGTELLMGQIANTNAQYISARLPDIGIGVYYHSVVGDNPARLKECLSLALSRSDLVVMTGGLGPTQDDLTKETVAQAMNRKLVLDQESLDKMESFFKKMNRGMTQNNVKQAYLPERSIIIRNRNGTAPGCIIEEGGKTIIMLPGPPSEMKPMFEETVIPHLMEKSEYRLESRFLRIFGIGESAMESMIMDLIDTQTNPTIAPYAKDGEVTLRLTAMYPKNGTHEDVIAPVEAEIRRRLGDNVYSNENKNMEEVAAELLLKTGTTIAVAESCTGGLVSVKLTDMPGISAVFDSGLVTYSNRSKAELLGVKPDTLEKYGAVSEQTAIEMAEGIRRVSGTELGLSITGIAGPDGGTPEKPVGLVFAALAHKDGVICKQLNLWGSRNRIRNVTTLHVFDMVRRYFMSKTNE